jgi:hypothetical protein
MIQFIFILLYIILNINVKIVCKYPKKYISVIKKINLETFLNMKIYFKKNKGSHLSSVMQIEVIKDIIDFNTKNLLKVEEMIFVPTNNPHDNYHNIWNTGNNLYYYSIKYGFRKNVLDYHNIIKYNGPYRIYSKEYYSNLKLMNNNEIETLLYYNPIMTYKKSPNYFKHGYHRIFAMIGRLLRGESYIPIYIIRI